MSFRIANMEDSEKTAFFRRVCPVCLDLFRQATSVRNFRKFTILTFYILCNFSYFCCHLGTFFFKNIFFGKILS